MGLIRRLSELLSKELRSDSERGRMVRSAGMTAGMKIGSTLLAFGASLLYARALGPHDYGLYAYVVAWTAVLTIPAGLGLSRYLLREGARLPQSVLWLRRWADGKTLVAGLLAAALLASAAFIPAAAGARWLFVLAAPLPLLNNLGAVRRALLQARGWVARSQWPFLLLSPALTLLVLIFLWLWQGSLHPYEIIVTLVIMALPSLLVNQIQLQRAAPNANATPQTDLQIRAALPFMWLGALYLLNNRTDLIMLGALKGGHDTGIYAVAARAAGLVPLIAGAANMALAPRIARLFQTGEHARLQQMISAAARRVLALTVPCTLGLIGSAWWLLDWLYGNRYTPAMLPLQILAGAQLVSIAIGDVSMMLNMAGHEKRSLVGLSMAVGLNIILNAVLIPEFGPMGAAIASSTSLVFSQLILWLWVRRILHIRPSGLGF